MPLDPEEMKTLSDATRQAIVDRRKQQQDAKAPVAAPTPTMSQSDFAKGTPLSEAQKAKRAADLAAALRKRGG